MERVELKKPRVRWSDVLAMRIADENEKDFLLATDPSIFFVRPHYDGYPAILVRLPEISVDQLESLLANAWRTRAPRRMVSEFDTRTGNRDERRFRGKFLPTWQSLVQRGIVQSATVDRRHDQRLLRPHQREGSETSLREPRIVGENNGPHSIDDALAKPSAREHVTISLSMRTLAIVFGIVVAVWIVQTLSSTLLIFAGAILLATAIDKPATWLQTHGLPRGVGILTVYVIVIAMLAVVVIVLIPLVDNEATRFTSQFSDYQSQFTHLLDRFGIHTNPNSHITADQITSKVSGNVNTIVTQLTSITLGIGHAAVVLFAILVISFMLAMDPTVGTRFMKRFLTDDAHARMKRISGDIHERIGGWVRGQVLVAVSFGVLFGVGLWALGIPYAASIGLAAAVLEMIPYLGGAITVIIASAIALTIGIPETIFVLALYTVLVNVESHILAPKFIGSAVGLPSVVVLAALFIGLETKGIVGVLLAVPASLVITAILDELWPGPEHDKSDGQNSSLSFIDRLRAFAARFTHPA